MVEISTADSHAAAAAVKRSHTDVFKSAPVVDTRRV